MAQEGDRILDKTRLGQDLEELNEQSPADLYEGPLSERELAEFHAVAAAMRTVLEEAEVDRVSEHLTPALLAVLDDARVDSAMRALRPEHRVALEKLYTAATAHDSDRGTYVSALERSTMLNQALMTLQPILALALRPDFRDGRPAYQQIVGMVNEVRRDITAGIWAQMMPRKKNAPVKAEDQTDDTDDTGDTGDDEPTGDTGDEPGDTGDDEPTGEPGDDTESTPPSDSGQTPGA